MGGHGPHGLTAASPVTVIPSDAREPTPSLRRVQAGGGALAAGDELTREGTDYCDNVMSWDGISIGEPEYDTI